MLVLSTNPSDLLTKHKYVYMYTHEALELVSGSIKLV